MRAPNGSQTKSASPAPFFGPAAQAMFGNLATRAVEIQTRISEIGEIPDNSVDDDERDRLRAEYRALEGEGEILEKVMAVAALLTKADDVANDLLRPAIKAAAEAATPLSGDIAEVVRILFKAVLNVAEELRPERQRNAEDTAWSRMTKFDAYVGAGFTKQQAFAMVLRTPRTRAGRSPASPDRRRHEPHGVLFLKNIPAVGGMRS